MGAIFSGYRYGIIRNLENDIVGFSLSPNCSIMFTEEDLFNALEQYAKKKVDLDIVKEGKKNGNEHAER